MKTGSWSVRAGVLAAAACAGFLAPAWAGDETKAVNRRTAPTPIADLAPDVDAYRQHIATLSNPFMEGRAPGTDGNRRAADYVEFHFRALNLKPAFPDPALKPTKDAGDAKDEAKEGDKDGADAPVVYPTREQLVSYRQPFEAPASTRPGDSYKLRDQGAWIAVAGEKAQWTPGTDFNVIGYTGSGEATGPLVFVGYAVRNEGEEYESIPEGTDLTGKVAMLLRFEPLGENGKSKWNESGWTYSSSLDSKMRAVARAGAAGIILVTPPGVDDSRRDRLEDMGLMGGRPLKIPVVMCTMEAGDRLVRAADEKGRSLLDLRKAADALGKGESGVLEMGKATVTLKATVERVPLMTDNVAAILPGRGGLVDEYVVIGAHYDHVGYGYLGADSTNRGKLHAGADDNASGTSGLLLIARKLADDYARLPEGMPARSILFMAFSAEESGLNGSAHYTKHLIAPREKHYVMINMDMIGRLREDKLELGGVGSGEGLKDWIQAYVDESGMKIATKSSGFGPSDHASFYRAKIPVLFFFTGLHKEYHKPADVFATVNIEGAVRVADLVHRVAIDMALRTESLAYAPPGGRQAEEKPADVAAADKDGAKPGDASAAHAAVAPSGDQETPRRPMRVRFGVMPGDYSGDTKGVLVDAITPGTPAEKAGVKAGDIIVRWNGKEIESVEAWMEHLIGGKPGDVVKLVVKRATGEVELEATLEERRRAAE